MANLATRVSLATISAVLFLSGAAMAISPGPERASLPSHDYVLAFVPAPLDRPTGFLSVVAKKKQKACPKGKIWRCEKLSAEVKALGYKECRCLWKGRSGH